jgi:hypothetical protein
MSFLSNNIASAYDRLGMGTRSGAAVMQEADERGGMVSARPDPRMLAGNPGLRNVSRPIIGGVYATPSRLTGPIGGVNVPAQNTRSKGGKKSIFANKKWGRFSGYMGDI